VLGGRELEHGKGEGCAAMEPASITFNAMEIRAGALIQLAGDECYPRKTYQYAVGSDFSVEAGWRRPAERLAEAYGEWSGEGAASGVAEMRRCAGMGVVARGGAIRCPFRTFA
jgi:hypothetical protein